VNPAGGGLQPASDHRNTNAHLEESAVTTQHDNAVATGEIPVEDIMPGEFEHPEAPVSQLPEVIEAQFRVYERIGLIESFTPTDSLGHGTDGWVVRVDGRIVPMTIDNAEAWLAGSEAAARYLARAFGVPAA
jgi:hypothetical protein